MRYAHLAPEAFKDDYGRLGAADIVGGEATVVEITRPLSLQLAHAPVNVTFGFVVQRDPSLVAA